MADATLNNQFPELVFGIAGPIGVDIGAIIDALSAALRAVRYDPVVIRLTEEMKLYRISREPENQGFFEASQDRR